MEGPEVFTANAAWNPRDQQIGTLYGMYLKALSDANALDFDDLLLKTVELFEQSEHVRDKYSEKFRFLMVDEYQDTNRPQYLLIQRLASRHRNLCVVGDPDQSIYKWRGADLRNILDFEHDFPEAKIVRLERNYRSTQVILDAASAVIAQNRNRKEKRLYTDRAGGAKVLYYRAGDDLDEAEFIARRCRDALHDDVENTVAILYRTNAQSRTLEDALRRSGTDYKIIGGVRFYERKEIKDILAYLKLVLNPHDSVSLRRVINVPARGIGKGVLESLDAIDLGEVAETDSPSLLAGLQPVVTANSLWARLIHAVEHRMLAPRATTSLGAFRDLIVGMAAMAPRETVSIALGKVIDQSGYLQDLREERTEEAESRIENLMELVSAAREYESRNPEPSLAGFVDQLSLLSDADEEAGLAQCTGPHDDDAQREGAGVSNRHHGRARRGAVPALAVERGRGRTGRGTAPLLRRDYSSTTAPGAHVSRAPAGVRGLPVQRAVALHRRNPPRTDRGNPHHLRLAVPVVVLPVPRQPLRQGRAARARGTAGVRLRRRGPVRARRASGPVSGYAIRNSARGRCSASSRSTTTPSSSCDSVRWGRRRCGRSLRSWKSRNLGHHPATIDLFQPDRQRLRGR